MIWWELPGYVVAFTTRVGGVSEAPYDSLNLSRGTGDDPERGRARTGASPARRSACRTTGSRSTARCTRRPSTAPSRACAARRATGSGPTSRDLPLLAMSADCLPIAIARTDGPPRLAVLHAGWRGLAEGVVEAGVAALGDGPKAAVIGPAIGPCCYEVGPEVSEPLRRRPDARRPPRPLVGRGARRCAAPASSRSSASTSARATIRSSSSRIGATGWRAASRG